MNKILQILLFYLMALSSAWSAEGVKWSDFELAFPVQGEADNKVVLNFIGKDFTGRKQITLVSSEGKNRKNMEIEERFIADVIAHSAAGDREEMLMLWAPSERDEIAQLMKSKEALEKNSAFFRNIKSTNIVSVVKYGAFYLFFVEHEIKGIGSYMKLYPTLSFAGEYFMSNALKGDVFYEKIASDLMPYMKNMKPAK